MLPLDSKVSSFRARLVRRVVTATAFASAASSLAPMARAEGAHCGSSANQWSAPAGALVVSQGGGEGSIVGDILKNMGEQNSHSMISHGPSGLSHATRTEDMGMNDSFGDFADGTTCSTPIKADDLKKGYPGAERIGVPGAYAFTENNSNLSAPDLTYYEAVDWKKNYTAPGECLNPQGVGTQITCDPMPSCPNPTPGTDGYVHCGPVAGCSNDAKVIGNLITCDAAQSGCANGGHIDRTTNAFVCDADTVGQVCDQWGIGTCQRGIDQNGQPICVGPNIRPCKHYHTQKFYHEQTDRDAAEGQRPPSQIVVAGYGSYGTDVRVVNKDSWTIANALLGLPTSTVPTQYGSYESYGYFYDFHQFVDIKNVYLGQVSTPDNGVVCSTFLSLAQDNALSRPVTPHLYSALKGAVAQLFQDTFNACHKKLDALDDATTTALGARCGGLDPVCHAAARQVVNCFAFGRCDTDDEDLYQSAQDGNLTAYSTSPDRLAGLGVHSPRPVAGVTTDPTTSVWASDVAHPVSFSTPGVYGCWD